MAFSHEEAAYKAYRQYLDAGYKAEEPVLKGNLWLVIYRLNDIPLGLALKLKKERDKYAEKAKNGLCEN